MTQLKPTEFCDVMGADAFDAYLRADYYARYATAEEQRWASRESACACLDIATYWWTVADDVRRTEASDAA